MHLRPLLDAILANPADDGARLVYADALDEAGDHERAEFVRVQVGIDRAGSPAEFEKLRLRSAELRFHHDDRGRAYQRLDWTANYGGDVCVFRRGFVHEVRCRLRDLPGIARAVFPFHPVEVVTPDRKRPSRTRIVSDEDTWFGWYRQSSVAADDVPVRIFNLMRGGSEWPSGRPHRFAGDGPTWAWWPSEDSALAALSDACVRYCRGLAAKPRRPRVRR
jgi:uncharacterized protein (TIGR02996 family)